MKRLSIIIPMYNVENYVERCIMSLENQDISKADYEIICINDGSPDDSRGVIVRLQEKFSNIVLIDQENRGVSNARNNGINAARGKYVIFIDPDDYISPNSLCKKIEEIEKHDLDVAYTGYTILDTQMRECYKYDLLLNDEKILSGVTFFNKYEKGNIQIT
jgi:glycosyltransferase involved in cell wall biosynthesis